MNRVTYKIGSLDKPPMVIETIEYVLANIYAFKVPDVKEVSEPGKPIIHAVDNSNKRRVILSLILTTNNSRDFKFIFPIEVAFKFVESFEKCTKIDNSIFDISEFMQYLEES